MKYTIYNINTGQIQKVLNCPESLIQLQYDAATQGCVEGDFSSLDFYIEDSVSKRIPAKPNSYCVFDFITKTWIDPRTLDEIKSMKWESIKKIRDQVENSSFVWNGHVFDCDVVSQSRIQGTSQLASLALMNQTPFSVDWTLANNTVVVLTAEDMLAVGKAMFEHINSCHQKSRTLRMQIESATTKEEVEAITWNSLA